MNDINGYHFLTFAGGMMFGSVVGYLIGLEGWLKEHVLNKKDPKED